MKTAIVLLTLLAGTSAFSQTANGPYVLNCQAPVTSQNPSSAIIGTLEVTPQAGGVNSMKSDAVLTLKNGKVSNLTLSFALPSGASGYNALILAADKQVGNAIVLGRNTVVMQFNDESTIACATIIH